MKTRDWKRSPFTFILSIVLGGLLGIEGLTSTLSANEPEKTPERLRRADSFFGIHLDFHCEEENKDVGANTTPEMVNELLDIVDPDFIQIDCKGHPGFSSYPTKVGNPSPHLVGDPLRVWREVTADRGVALYMHYSGVMDYAATDRHPEWAMTNKDGEKNRDATSFFGGYTDQLLIPQLVELGKDYGVDGVWIDGDCWATRLDYGERAKKEFMEKTGLETIPTGPDDPNWSLWTDFHREAFRERLRHLIAEVKKEVPDFQIASNWAFTELMPEPVSAPVDFISGDYSCYNSINTSRMSSRIMSTQGVPWDLMAWSFVLTEKKPWPQKNGPQLEREAACVLSQGGGFQAYYTQNADGSVDLEKVKPMRDVARFCRERKDFCFHSTAVPQVALIIPTEANYRLADRQEALFRGGINDWQRGILSAMLENQYSVEVYSDEVIEGKINDYPALVICQWNELRPEFKASVLDYVKNGGGLFLIGEGTIRIFEEDFQGIPFTVSEVDPALKSGPFGEGRVAELGRNVSQEYVDHPDPSIRELVGAGLKMVFPDPDVTVEGTPFVDVSLRRIPDGRLTVQLVNTSGPHAKEGILETIDPVGPLTVTVKTARAPKSVVLEPGSRPCDFTYENGRVTLRIDQVAIYDILVLDDVDHHADWMAGNFGLFTHFLPKTPDLTEEYDVKGVADQIESTGAKWFMITMYQNAGPLNAPNAYYDEITGYSPGERSSRRDLILDLAEELIPRGIKLGVYLTGQTPNRDERAQEAFGLPVGAGTDQPISLEFAEKWGKVFQEWTDRYGEKVSLWWVDGCYEWIGFTEEIAEVYKGAILHGNPDAVVAFNPGVKKPEWKTSLYSAGEIVAPFVERIGNRIGKTGSQNHILTFLGDFWGRRNTRFSESEWTDWVADYLAHGGAVSLDLGPNVDPDAGPVGLFSEEQLSLARAIGERVAKENAEKCAKARH